ncbi:MAG: hypothetical protein LAQ69_43200 [Acidobacteriia bacterium]|nr:hypothetical protein [Terriglobia bacterium]
MKNTLTTLSFPLFLFAAAILDAQTPQTLSVDKNPLNFSVQVGGSAVTQTLNVIGSGGFTTFPSTSPPGTSWLRVNPVNGSAPTALTVTADPSGLPAGPYVGDLFIFSTNPAALAVDVKVNLTVSTISVSPTSLTFAFQMGATPPATQSLTLSGPATYNAVATASGGNWLLLSTGGIAAGTAISGGASPGTITVSVSPTVLAALTPATYNGSITITPTSGASNGPITIPVTLTVSAAPPVTVSPNSVSLAFQTTGGSNNLAQQTVTLSTNGIQGVPYTLALFFDNNPAGRIFFTVAPGRIGTIPANGSAQLTFAYDTTTNLPAIPQPGQSGCTSSGCTYTGKATLLTPGGTPTQQDIPVTLLVSESARTVRRRRT